MKTFRNIMIVLLLTLMLTSCMTTKAEAYATIAVEGSGSVKLEPDMVSFTVRIDEIASTTFQAQNLTNTKIAAILAIVRNAGIDDKAIKTGSLSIYTDYSWEDGKQVWLGERVAQTLTITSKDIPGFAGLVDQIAQAVSGLEFNNVVFDKQDKTEAYAQAREKAIDDAKAKAMAYAKASDLVLVMPINISEGSFGVRNSYNYPMTMMKAEMATAGDSVATEIPSGELSVSASISITYKAVL